jgi:Sulfotransferase domain.
MKLFNEQRSYLSNLKTRTKYWVVGSQTLGQAWYYLEGVRNFPFVDDPSGPPTIFHITQYKAGSQWIYNILQKCAADLLIEPKVEVVHFLHDPILPGKIYPTIYLPKWLFSRKRIPARSHRFIVFRDLRDILVSAYFSLRQSHSEIGAVGYFRSELSKNDFEQGMLWIIRHWLWWNASVCESWISSGEPWIKYEDLLENDAEILERTLLEQCQLDIDRVALRRAIQECRFESISGGRKRGEEDAESHFRKGISGDWRRFFTPRIKSAFKKRYGELLIAAGYEDGLDW